MQGEMFFPEIEVQSNEKVEAQATHIAKWLQIEFDFMERDKFKGVFGDIRKIRELQLQVNEKKRKQCEKALADFPETVSLLVKQKLERTSGISFQNGLL